MLKSRKFAAGLTAVICVLSLGFGFKRSADKKAAEITDLWYNGIAADGYTAKSADAYLREYAVAAERLALIASDSLGKDAPGVKKVMSYLGTLSPESGTAKLSGAVSELIAAMGTAADTSEARKEIGIISGASAAYLREAAKYKSEADAFRKDTRSFPFGLLRLAVPVNDPITVNTGG